jgi:hypothetical protein
MKYNEALKIMERGGHAESLTSNTAYSIDVEEHQLYAEGLPVQNNYITKEEKKGAWREVYIVQSQEDLDKLTDVERETLFEETLRGAKQRTTFNEKYRRNKELIYL